MTGTTRCRSRFTGKIDKLTLKIDRPKLSPEDEARLRNAMAKASDGPAPGEAGAYRPLVAWSARGKIEKIRDCRQEALAKDLDVFERIKFIDQCAR